MIGWVLGVLLQLPPFVDVGVDGTGGECVDSFLRMELVLVWCGGKVFGVSVERISIS